jgi:hypothetical protein
VVSETAARALGGNGTYEVALGTIRNWRAESVELPEMRVAILSNDQLSTKWLPDSGALPLGGMLGSDLLARYGTVSLDYTNQVMRLGPGTRGH